MRALLIVDVQNDFCPGGTLAVPKGDEIVPVINNLMDYFDLVIASKDWHPENSSHFDVWPVHCVRGTAGAELHPEIKGAQIDLTLLKGTGPADDGYSAFSASNIDLLLYLKENKVDDLYICGLATEYCVKATALDAAKHGFNVFVIEDAVRGVNQNAFDDRRAIEEMKHKGVVLVNSSLLTAV